MYDTVKNVGQIPPCDKFKLGHQNDGAGHLWCVLANTPHGVIPAKVSLQLKCNSNLVILFNPYAAKTQTRTQNLKI